MKLFPIPGGIHPEYRKTLASEVAISSLPLPARLYVPLQQHIGVAADALVGVGERVRKGQLVARGRPGVSASQHAPTSGIVVEVGALTAPHPSGLAQPTLVIEADGLDQWADLPAPIDAPFAGPPQAIQQRVDESGIVGMGGAAFPSAVKLDLGRRYQLDTLLLNGAECEPYLTCDDRIMREYAAEVIDGARLMAHALQTGRVIVAIEDNKPAALAAMRAAAAALTPAADGGASVEVVGVPVQYPMGSERHIVLAVTGRETPARRLTAELGVVVHNVATARAVHHAVRFGRPLISRVVTVSGGAIRQPKNVELPIGTPVSALLDFCGGFSSEPASLILGGPMMGQPLPGTDVPLVKGSSGVLALTREEINEQPQSSCIRCGSCIEVCPCGLVPLEMAAYIRKDRIKEAATLGVGDCMSCGSCSWVCPSHLPLVHYFNFAKGKLAAEQREQRKIELTRVRSELHNARLEKVAAERAAKRAPAAAPAAPAAPGGTAA